MTESFLCAYMIHLEIKKRNRLVLYIGFHFLCGVGANNIFIEIFLFTYANTHTAKEGLIDKAVLTGRPLLRQTPQ